MSTIAYTSFNTLLLNLFKSSQSSTHKSLITRNMTNQLSESKSSISDPRVSFLEERVASLEKEAGAMATKSVRSARFSLIKNLLQSGDNVVTFNSWSLFHEDKHLFDRFGIEIRLSSNGKLETFKELIDDQTKLIYLETISPEYLNIPDFLKIILHAHLFNIPVVVDNSASVGGYLVAPIKEKANIVLESLEDYLPTAAKYRAVVVDGANYPWFNGRFDKLKSSNYRAFKLDDWNEVKQENIFNNFSLLDFYRKNQFQQESFLIPKDPFSLARRLEDIPNKAKLKSDNALKLARYLQHHHLIQSVNYTGLSSNNSHFQALSYFQNGFGHYLSFKLTTRPDLVKRFFQELAKEVPLRRNLSYDVKTQQISLNVPAIELEELISYFDRVFALLKGSLEYYRVFNDDFFVRV